MKATVSRFSFLAVPILMVGLLLPASTAAAASSLPIYVPAIGGECLYVTAPANKTITLLWKDDAGAVKESTSMPTGTGDVFYCSPSNVIEVGDRLKITKGAASHTLTIPDLTATVNRTSDVMSGTGPAGATLKLLCGGHPFGQFEPCLWTRKVTVNGSGNWSAQVPFDMFGGRIMSAKWRNTYGDVVFREVTVPFFQVFLGQARFLGVTEPLSSATVDLLDASLDEKGSGNGDSGQRVGSFVGQLRDDQGHLVSVEPGDHVSSDVAGDADFVVPTITAAATAVDDRVVGQCELTESYRSVLVELYRGGTLRGTASEGMEDGSFDFDFQHAFPDPVNVKVGDKLYIKCEQTEADFAVKVIIAQ